MNPISFITAGIRSIFDMAGSQNSHTESEDSDTNSAEWSDPGKPSLAEVDRIKRSLRALDEQAERKAKEQIEELRKWWDAQEYRDKMNE